MLGRDRKAASQLGISVEEYRVRKSAEEAGRTLEEEQEVRLFKTLPHIRGRAAESGVAPSVFLANPDAYSTIQGLARMHRTMAEWARAAAERRGTTFESFVDTFDPDAAHAAGTALKSTKKEPLATLGQAVMWDDPPRLMAPTDASGRLTEYPLSAQTFAIVETAGNVAATRGRNLANKGWGALATTAAGVGPLGAFLFGNAKETIHDGRELYLIVDDPDWGFALPVHPSFGQAARDFALALNRAARKLQSGETSQPPADTLDQLERLAKLKDSGALTEEEFQAQKARLLAD